jgi:hypothetical protein
MTRALAIALVLTAPLVADRSWADAGESARSAAAAATPPATLDEAARIAMVDVAEPSAGPEGEAAPDADAEMRSPTKAFFLSMLLPGLGQSYAGAETKALVCYFTEGALWAMFAVFKIQEDNRTEDFQEWAETFAGARIDGYDRDEEYFQTISRYLSSDEYNFEVKWDARLIYPDDRAAQLAYISAYSVSGDDTWAWTSNDTRDQYRVIRSGALDADTHANWTLGGLILLRVVSAIDAALETGAANRRVAGGGLSLSPAFPSGEPGLAVGYSRSF